MREQQRLKLTAYRQKLQDARLKQLTESMAKLGEHLSDIKSPIVNVDVDNSEIAEAIKSIKMPDVIVNPQIKVDVPKQEAPVVVVKDEDIYARYRRVNSEIGRQGEYHGFVDKDGNWFIQLESSADNGPDRTRYFVGDGQFSAGWPKRESYTYKAYDKVTIL